MRITTDLLRRHGACPDQVVFFERIFPDGADPVRDLDAAIIAGLDIFWCVCLLTGPALAEYERVTTPALAEYERVTTPAWAEYRRVTAAAWAEYERVTAAARAEYERMAGPALAAALAACEEEAPGEPSGSPAREDNASLEREDEPGGVA